MTKLKRPGNPMPVFLSQAQSQQARIEKRARKKFNSTAPRSIEVTAKPDGVIVPVAMEPMVVKGTETWKVPTPAGVPLNWMPQSDSSQAYAKSVAVLKDKLDKRNKPESETPDLATLLSKNVIQTEPKDDAKGKGVAPGVGLQTVPTTRQRVHTSTAHLVGRDRRVPLNPRLGRRPIY